MEKTMNLHDFYYDLPQELIAQDPLEDRSSSRLMVLNKNTGKIQHHIFKDIVKYLHKGDCLVINNTKVIPARLFGSKVGTDAKIEVLLLKRKEKIYQFKYIMEQSLAKIISEGKCHLLTQTAPHLFTLKTDQLQYNQEFKDELDKYGIRLEGVNEELKYILCRVSQFIINPNILKEGIETLNIVLNYMYE